MPIRLNGDDDHGRGGRPRAATGRTGGGNGNGVCAHGGQRRYLPHRAVYLDRDQAYAFAQDYNGIAPIESVQVEEWENGAPPGAYDGPYWRAQWWARVPVSKRRAELRHTRDGERRDDFDIRQEWWTGDALPDAKVVRRELAGIPRVEVAGLSKEKVEELF
jgi:hypothetical protein